MKKLLLLLLCSSSLAYAESIDLAPLVITPSRMSEAEEKVNANVTVIDQATIERSHASSVAQLLQNTVGIQVSDNSSLKTQTVDIRGMGDTVGRGILVLVNNRRVNPVDNSGPDFLLIPVSSIEQVEIIRGAGSVLYGDNAVGGVINIITKKGKVDGLHGSLAASYDSFDSLRTTQEFTGKKGMVDYYINTNQFDTDGYRANSQYRSRDYIARFGVNPNERVGFDLNGTWHEDDYGLPGGLIDAKLAELGRRGTANPEDFAKSKDRMLQLTTTLNPWVEEDWGKFIIDSSVRNRDTYAVFYSFGEYATKRNINSWAVNSRYELSRDVFDGHQFSLVSGVDLDSDDNLIYGSGSNSDHLNITKESAAIYANTSYELVDKLFVDAGTRYQKTVYTFNQMSSPKSYQDQRPDKQAARGGLRYEYAKGSQIFANVEQTFRFLSTDEWYDTFNGLNTGLNQQKGVQYQAGIKHRFNDIFDVAVTPYLINNRNEIFLDPAGGGGFGANSNYDRTRRMGIEYAQAVHLKEAFNLESLDKFDWRSSYTYQDAEFANGAYKGKKIPMAATHQATTGLVIGFLKHIDYGINARYVGRQYAINDTNNTLPATDPYVVVDNQLTFYHDNWEVFGGIDNLFGERYDVYVSKAVSSNNKSHFPAAERTFKFGAKVKF